MGAGYLHALAVYVYAVFVLLRLLIYWGSIYWPDLRGLDSYENHASPDRQVLVAVRACGKSHPAGDGPNGCAAAGLLLAHGASLP